MVDAQDYHLLSDSYVLIDAGGHHCQASHLFVTVGTALTIIVLPESKRVDCALGSSSSSIGLQSFTICSSIWIRQQLHLPSADIVFTALGRFEMNISN